MSEWTVNIFSGLVGAILALCIREFIEWLKRPQLKIGFEKRSNNLYISDNIHKEWDFENGIKQIRIAIKNNGLQAAYNCETKMEIYNLELNEIENNSLLLWSKKKDPIFNKKESYNPITINRKDTEYLEFCYLNYSRNNTQSQYKPDEAIGISSLQWSYIRPNKKYRISITIFSDNAEPSNSNFYVYWDGTIEGFYKAFSKG